MADEPSPFEALTTVERAALRIAKLANERPAAKRLQQRYLRAISQQVVGFLTGRRIYVHGVERYLSWRPNHGVLLASNHRSFFDQYILMLALYEAGAEFADRVYFPVRSNFFYDNPLGPVLNLLIGGGAMYPPIFRNAKLTELNKRALEGLRDALAMPGTVVGIHPEGTRGKGPNPYELLKAQPGIGQIVLQGKPVVVPIFQLGLTNDFGHDVRANFMPGVRHADPIILVFGEPVDYSDLAAKKPRPVLYKLAADRINAEVERLGDTEREIRARCARGEIDDSDAGWLTNLGRRARQQARSSSRPKGARV